jgi:hypothetical protein
VTPACRAHRRGQSHGSTCPSITICGRTRNGDCPADSAHLRYTETGRFGTLPYRPGQGHIPAARRRAQRTYSSIFTSMFQKLRVCIDSSSRNATAFRSLVWDHRVCAGPVGSAPDPPMGESSEPRRARLAGFRTTHPCTDGMRRAYAMQWLPVPAGDCADRAPFRMFARGLAASIS